MTITPLETAKLAALRHRTLENETDGDRARRRRLIEVLAAAGARGIELHGYEPRPGQRDTESWYEAGSIYVGKGALEDDGGRHPRTRTAAQIEAFAAAGHAILSDRKHATLDQVLEAMPADERHKWRREVAEAYAQAELIHSGASAYECAAIANIRRIEGWGRNAYEPINENGDHLQAMEKAGESLRRLLDPECGEAAMALEATPGPGDTRVTSPHEGERPAGQ